MRFVGVSVLALAAASLAGAAASQTWDVAPTESAAWRPEASSVPVNFAAQPLPAADVDRAFDGVFETRLNAAIARADRFEGVYTEESWRDAGFGAVDRFSLTTAGELRRRDGGPLALNPADRAAIEPDYYEFTYTRGWPSAVVEVGDGLQMDVTPHAGVSMSSRGGAAVAGATIRIGENLGVRDGREAFGDRGRWYLFAAGEGRAVGYNFARTRDGDYARSGFTHDSGAFMGDAQVGVAWRRGDLQTSFGYVYREHEADEIRISRGLDREVDEGVVAFQLSIKPEW